jgi:hypothetical protein
MRPSLLIFLFALAASLSAQILITDTVTDTNGKTTIGALNTG